MSGSTVASETRSEAEDGGKQEAGTHHGEGSGAVGSGRNDKAPQGGADWQAERHGW